MWKCVPRNLRESVERRVTRKISRSEKPPAQDAKQTPALQNRLIGPTTQHFLNLPTADGLAKDRFTEFGKSNWERQRKRVVASGQKDVHGGIITKIIPTLAQQFCNVVPKDRNVCSDNNEKTCGWRKKKKEKQQENRWENGPNIEHTWLGALSWSTALVLGWYLIQPLCRYWVFPCDKERKWTGHCRLQEFFSNRGKKCHLKRHEVRYIGFVDALSRTALAQPVIPWVQVEKSASLDESDVFTVPVQITSTHEEINGSSAVPFGPQTAEEALNEAAESFLKVHNSSVGDIDNSLGVSSMQEGKHKEAFSFFIRGMEFNNPVATFNLAICYEKGLGTNQDFRKAAKYYKMASEQGHATATYNLGVFHVHGLGGLPVDHNQAHELFKKASTLGQSDAKRALNMMSHFEERKIQDESTNALLQMLGLMQIPHVNEETTIDGNLNTSSENEESCNAMSNGSQLGIKNLTYLVEDAILKYKFNQDRNYRIKKEEFVH